MSEETSGQEPSGLGGSAAASSSDGAAGSLAPTTGWKDILESEFRNEPTIQNIRAENTNDALNALAKQAIHAQKMVGVDRIPALKPGATAEEQATWRQEHLGVPKDSADYTFGDKIVFGNDEAGNPVESDEPEAMIEAFRSLSHSQGLTQEQAAGALSEFLQADNSVSLSNAEVASVAMRESMAKFADELGHDYKPTMDLAQDAYNRLVPETLQAKVPESLLNEPEFIQMFADFGKSLSDDRVRGGNVGGNDIYEPAQALRAIQELEGSSGYKDLLSGSLDHDASATIRDKRASLYKQAYPHG